MIRLDAYHLPWLEAADVESWEERDYDNGRVTLRFPILHAAALEHHTHALRGARRAGLQDRPAEEIVEIIDSAAARLQDPTAEARGIMHEALPAITGYSRPMLELGLDRILADWRAPALHALLQAELGDPAVLDGFTRHAAGVRTRAFGPELVMHVFAGNVPGVAPTSLVRALLVKSASLGKTASGEPLLAVLLARTLGDIDAAIGRCLAVTYWPGGSPLDAIAFRAADAVIAYGGRAATARIRERMPPGTPLIEHGPRISFAMIAADALQTEADARRIAEAAARATAIFDQQGCVSPHLLYVEEGGAVTVRAFAALLASALARLGRALPRGPIPAGDSAAIHHARAAAEFRAIAGEEVEVHASADTGHTVIFDARAEFEPSCLNRLIRVKPVTRLEHALPFVAPHRELLQTAALEAPEPRRVELASRLGALGVTRVTTLGEMPWPPPAWHHDGRGPLRELLRWVDLEG